LSTQNTLKSDLSDIKEQWKGLDPKVKFLDTMALAGVGLFIIAFLIVSIADVKPTVSNVSMMIYPAIIAGYSHVFRLKIAEDSENHEKARKDFIKLTAVTTLLVLFSFLYSAIVS
jgi:hypothetical protein